MTSQERELMGEALDVIETFDVEGFYEQFREELQTALTQPEPEPVAWMYDFPDPDNPREDIVHNWTAYSLAEVELNYGFNIRPLYTALPKNEWVGLTDEDRKEIFESMPGGIQGFCQTWGWLPFTKAIEAKLKEKNT